MHETFIQSLERIFAELARTELFWYAIGALLVVLCVILFIFILKHRSRPISLKISQGGNLEISRTALTDAIQSVCVAEGLERRPSVRILFRNNQLYIALEVRVPVHFGLEDLTEKLQTAVRDFLKQKLGLAVIGGVDIRVTHLNVVDSSRGV